jgi:biopolymer transport protein ExbD
MAHKKMGAGGGHGEDAGGHGDRPWVYFMIDSFFLVTQFFVLTFHVRSDEVILPQKLPPGGGGRPTKDVAVEAKEQINVHVARDNPASPPTYLVKSGGSGQQNTLAQFKEMLRSTASAKGPDKLSVRISYDSIIPFGDVMPVFNECTKLKIAECGLIPLRTAERN